MKMIYLGLWDNFACLAGACPSTCCAGWNIVADEQTISRIRELPATSELREDILRHIVYKKGEYRFENQRDGRCSMLREDGLCRIWHDAGEMFLCHTCRKFPQLIDREGETIRLSMDASCPVVARYLWEEEVTWFCMQNLQEETEQRVEGSVKRERFDPSDWLQTENCGIDWKKLTEKTDNAREDKEIKSGLNDLLAIWNVMEGCLDLLLQSPEMPYLSGCYDYFEDWSEEQFIRDYRRFREKWQRGLNQFAKNYISYRMFGLSFSDSKVGKEERTSQILGELSLFYITFFSRFYVLEKFSEAQVVENICWVYRFTAHGSERRRRTTDWFVENRHRLESFFDLFYDVGDKRYFAPD